MNRNAFLLTLASVATAATICAQPRPSTGVIRGTVVNEYSQPVAGADVTAQLADELHQGLVRYVQTDAAGRFVINGLKSARYQVFAMKEADGYANPRWFIYDNGTVPVVQLSDAAASDVLVQIGPKAARISGTITDAATGDPIETVSFRVWRGNNCASALSLSATPKYDLLVPSGAEIALEVSVPGYEVWRYNPGPNAAEPTWLNLPSGSRMPLNIKLQPITKTTRVGTTQ
ncbi:MAG: carboxypeptidase-like regulatory domain-containing protein [Bryobacteraceae bacterium]|jgi:hypothetical protein